jgi:precorrin-6A/cobalt-precorrin-6A reductase
MNVLILGGTTEASAIATALAGDGLIRATLSLAGRTRAPVLPAVPSRRGGFGGVEGLARYLRDQNIDALVDATHPFAAQMSRHAALASARTGVKLLAVVRPAWIAGPDDRWIEVADMIGAVAALGPEPRRVFLTVGQQELAPFRTAPWHDYLIRSVEPPAPDSLPPRVRCIAARGPFTEPDECALLVSERIDILVTKNSGGTATEAKLAAARALLLPVVMVARPPAEPVPSVPDAAAALDWLRHVAAST